MSPLLAYVEHDLPTATPEERFELARAHSLALEIAHKDDDRAVRATPACRAEVGDRRALDS